MIILGKKVFNKTLGEGHVIIYNDSNPKDIEITVKYDSRDVVHSFPSAFLNGYISTEDPEINSYINDLRITNNRKREESMNIWKKKQMAIKAAQEAAKRHAIKQGGMGRIKKQNSAMNYGFRLNYCDGGSSANSIGFAGLCSEKLLQEHQKYGAYNIVCKDQNCPCCQHYKGQISRQDLEQQFNDGILVCYESKLLIDWIIEAGIDAESGKPRTLPAVGSNKLIVLTTRDIGEQVDELYVFAAFIVGDCDKGKQAGTDKHAGYAKALQDCSVIFTPEEARSLKFWDIYVDPNNPASKNWGRRLQKPMDDENAEKFFEAMLKVTQKNQNNYDKVLNMQRHFVR